MLHDLRYTLRLLVKSRGFTALAVAVLAVGIGISTALFSVVYAIFFRPLPVHAPEELVYLYWIGGGFREPNPSVLAYPDYEYFRDHPEAFSGLTAHWGWNLSLRVDDVTETVAGELVTASYFDVLGVKPILGRAFRPEEDDVTSTEVAVVISHALWSRRFGADPAVIGRRVRLSDSTTREATVVGVMPQGFAGVSDPWTPSHYWLTFAQTWGREGRRYAVAPIARLKPGISVRQAQAIVGAQGLQMHAGRRHREGDRYLVFAAKSVRMPFWPMRSVAPRRLTLAMSVVVAIVLLVTMANVAGMLLARGVTRSGELAVRVVLGASGWRVARQLLIEGILLTAAAGGLGVVVAVWLIELFRRYTPERFAVSVWLDPNAWLFTAMLCAVLGLLISVAPAMQSARLNLLSSLPGVGTGARREARRRLRNGVVIPQIGLSLVLLLVAAMHIRTLLAIESTDLGYDTRNVAVVTAALRAIPGDDTPLPQRAEKGAQRARAFFRQLLSRVQEVPGAAGVALAGGLPVRHPAQAKSNYMALSYEAFLAGDTSGHGTERLIVSPKYFDVLRTALVMGRDFDARDGEHTAKVAIISESLARQLWPGRSPLGQSFAAMSSWNGPNQRIDWLEVVGIVEDVRPILQEHGTTPYVYLPMSQQWAPPASMTVVARIEGNPLTSVQAVRAAVEAADTFADVARVQTLEQIAGEILYPRRLAAWILGVSAVLALVLATVGLYAVVSYSVEQRVHEIGVRFALGANRADILRLVVGEGAKLGAIGAALGLALTYSAVRLTSNLFLGMPRFDALTLAAVPLVLLGIVLLASYLPASRASRVDPMETLRAL